MAMASSANLDSTLFNFRDFGGHRVKDGGHVVARSLYRSGNHARLGPAAVSVLLAFDFSLIIDLRYPDERTADPSPWPGGWAGRLLAHEQANGLKAPHLAIVQSAAVGEQAVHSAYRILYRALPFDPTYRALFADALRRSAVSSGRVLIHCTAGKDRTGLLVGLLLDLLGVPRDAIVNDYVRSSRSPALQALRAGLAERLAGEGNDHPDAVAKALIGVQADYLNAAFAAIDDQFGSIEAYFSASGVNAATIARLQDRFIVR